MTPEHLDALCAVMRKHDVTTLKYDGVVACSGGFTISMVPPKPVASPVDVDQEQARREAIKREDEILFASSEGFAR